VSDHGNKEPGKEEMLPLRVRLRKKRWFYPTAGFLLLFIAFIFTSRFAERPPVIESLAP